MAEIIQQILEEKETELDGEHRELPVEDRSMIELSSAQSIAEKIEQSENSGCG